MKKRVPGWLVALWLVLGAITAQRPAWAATLEVGAGKTYATIADAWAMVNPGDVIEVQGGATYSGTILFTSDHNGTAAQPVTVRGIPVNGKRPILKGIGPGQYDNMVVLLGANNFVMESFEVIGNDNDTDYCLVHMGDNITLRDLVVHDCLHQAGLVGDDTGSGSLTLEYSEFYWNGDGEYSHQIYMATDQAMYPGATFRMQYNYVHDGLGGNNVATRSERNEIYYNWIEGAYYHELDLTGPDVGNNPRRCDSDVVGNVFVKTSSWRVARIGGDGSGNSMGRFRFVNNTMIMAPVSTVVISLQLTVSTLEMYNNVIMAPMAGIKVYDVNEQMGPDAVMAGSNNWILTGTTSVPTVWTSTLMGADPGFVAPTTYDYRPTATSPLVNAGTSNTAMSGSLAFVNPLPLPLFDPPERRLIAVGTAEARVLNGAPSIGAFEPTAAAPGPAPPGVGGSPPSIASGGGSSGEGGSGSSSGGGGCKCRVAPEPGGPEGLLAGIAALGLTLSRRRRRRA